MAAARRFFDKAIRENGTPDKVTMDKSGANKAAIDEVNRGRTVPITVRQVKYLNNIVEQDHRAIKRVTRPIVVSKRHGTNGQDDVTHRVYSPRQYIPQPSINTSRTLGQ
jgi:putative transposase